MCLFVVVVSCFTYILLFVFVLLHFCGGLSLLHSVLNNNHKFVEITMKKCNVIVRIVAVNPWRGGTGIQIVQLWN